MFEPTPLFAPGDPVDWTPDEEAGCFMLCPSCNQPIDCRDLGAVLHHEEFGHLPLSIADATRMVTSPAFLQVLREQRWRSGLRFLH